MAKQRKLLPEPKPSGRSRADESVSLRSAETLGRVIGTLQPGKDADLCAVSLAGAHVRPVHDPVAALFHAARGTDVVMTAVRGRVLYRDGRVLTLDEAALAEAVEEPARRIREARA